MIPLLSRFVFLTRSAVSHKGYLACTWKSLHLHMCISLLWLQQTTGILWTAKHSGIQSKGSNSKLVIQENMSYPLRSFQNGRLWLPHTPRIVSPCNWSQTRLAYFQVKLFVLSISKYSWGHESEHSLLGRFCGRCGTLRLQSLLL